MRIPAFTALCILAILTAVISPNLARAQSQENGAIVVTVMDADSGKPVEDAQVFLLGGDTPQNTLTNAKGLLIFEGVQPALYRVRVEADGYAETGSTPVAVDVGQRVDVAVKLSPTLKTIASILAHPSVNVSVESIGQDSAQRKVSQSLSEALNRIAGVSVDDQVYGAGSAFNISLRGADASGTAYSIDGMHVGGAAAQAMAGMSDLFSGASVDFSPSAMSTAGSVDFYTVQPSKIWTYSFTGVAGNYGNTLGSWTVTGGAGKVAMAFERTAGGEDSPLDGTFFADESGSAYVHQGGYAQNASLFKATLNVSPVSQLKYTLIGGDDNSSYICASATTILPCGMGPGNTDHATNLMQTLAFSSLAGHVQYNLFTNHGSFRTTDSEPNRAVNGIRNPYYSSGTFPWWNIGVYASATVRRHTASGGFYQSVESSTYTSTYNGAQTLSSSRSERSGSLWVSDKVKSNDKLALTHTVSQASGTGAGSSLELYEEATWQPRRADVFSFGAGVGSAQPAQAFTSPIGDPLSADYDCYNGSVFIQGPSDQAVRQASVNYSAGWRHTWKGGFVDLNLYRNTIAGQNMRAGVPFDAEPDSLFPNGAASYMADLQNIWSQPTECGSIPFEPSHVYVTQEVSGFAQAQQGFTLSAQVPLGKNVVAFPRYVTTSAYLTSLDPRLMAPGSYYAVGTQLPHRPLHSAGLILDGILAHSGMEWLLDAEFTSANNGPNLPAYTLYNAGVVFHAQRGSLRVFLGNVFGTHTGLFTTYQGVYPMPLQGGGSFAYSTTPLPPRSFTVQYQVRWRQHSTPPKPTHKPPAN